MDQSSNTIDLNHIFQIYQIAVNKFKAHQCLMKEKLCKISGDIYNFQQYKPYCNNSESDIASSDSLMRTLDNYGLTLLTLHQMVTAFLKQLQLVFHNVPIFVMFWIMKQ